MLKKRLRIMLFVDRRARGDDVVEEASDVTASSLLFVGPIFATPLVLTALFVHAEDED